MKAEELKAIPLYKPFHTGYGYRTPNPYKYSVKVKLPNGKYKLIHFGHYNYHHYKDKIGLWSFADHNDPKRRAAYRARHGKIKLKNGRFAYKDKTSPEYWAWHYLW